MIRNLFVLGAMSVLAQGALANDGAFEAPKTELLSVAKVVFRLGCEAEKSKSNLRRREKKLPTARPARRRRCG